MSKSKNIFFNVALVSSVSDFENPFCKWFRLIFYINYTLQNLFTFTYQKRKHCVVNIHSKFNPLLGFEILQNVQHENITKNFTKKSHIFINRVSKSLMLLITCSICVVVQSSFYIAHYFKVFGHGFHFKNQTHERKQLSFQFQKKLFWLHSFSSATRSVASHVIGATCRCMCLHCRWLP